MRVDPYLGFRFHVEIDGLEVAGFSEVTGLEAQLDVHEYHEGGLNDYMHKLPGSVSYPSNLVLKRGVVERSAVWRWCEASLDGIEGIVERKTIAIVLVDASGDEKRRWTFQGAYPVKWTGPELRATTSDVALESLELAHRGLDRTQ